MDFDLNLALVPITTVFFVVYLLDLFYFKQRKTKDSNQVHPLINWSYDFLPFFAFLLVLRSFIIEPFNIPSSSMKPTLFTGDFILVNKFSYGIKLPIVHTQIIPVGKPKRGDVVVFRHPKNPKIYYIKRVIGISGDQITHKNGLLSVNGNPYSLTKDVHFQYKRPQFNGEHTYSTIYQENIEGRYHLVRDLNNLTLDAKAPFLKSKNPNNDPAHFWEISVPNGNYFVMGDNRDQSEDSRFWGFVPEANLTGKAFYVWMHKTNGMATHNFSNIRHIQ